MRASWTLHAARATRVCGVPCGNRRVGRGFETRRCTARRAIDLLRWRLRCFVHRGVLDQSRAIVALHARYPCALAALKDGWWNDHAHLETLSALAVELSFQRLADYAQPFKSEGGGVQAAWRSGAPPIQWPDETAAV
jgi:hypothetical protein